MFYLLFLRVFFHRYLKCLKYCFLLPWPLQKYLTNNTKWEIDLSIYIFLLQIRMNYVPKGPNNLVYLISSQLFPGSTPFLLSIVGFLCFGGHLKDWVFKLSQEAGMVVHCLSHKMTKYITENKHMLLVIIILILD